MRLEEVMDADDIAGLLGNARDEEMGLISGLLVGRSDRLAETELSPRERDVGRLLAQGRTNAEIAEALFISEVTAKVHVRHILRKLGVRNRAEAAVLIAERLRSV
jgi:DNA-binding NarL/FixJ family response regulator